MPDVKKDREMRYELPTAEEAERLHMLTESAAKVIKAVSIILMHGYGPNDPDKLVQDLSNGEFLEFEVLDFIAIAKRMVSVGDLSDDIFLYDLNSRWKYLSVSARYQG